MNDHDEVWMAVAQLLRAQLTGAVWFSTFQDVVPLESTPSALRVSVPSTHVRERIQTRYLPLVTDALAEVGMPQHHFDMEVRAEPAPMLPPDGDNGSIGGAERVGTNPAPRPRAQFTRADAGSDVATAPPRKANDAPTPVPTDPNPTMLDAAGLNPRYTFETFVRGASNQFPLAAALRVAETPARSYNPLFIYGAAGLGKTHLLHAIGHYVHLNYQHHEVRYVSTETFLNEYVDAIRTTTMATFKRRYREIDVLLIDDIQFLENKEGLQEEFFHTFNSLHGANKQIVISSDRMPDNIPALEERLRGRFKWGLITDIQPPDLETRLAILRNKSERDHAIIGDESLEFIAANITTNIRELEGALIRVTAYASLNDTPITIELAEQLLSDLLVHTKPKARSDEELLAAMAQVLGFDVDALKGKSRQRPLVTSRQIAMYAFRELTDLSYPAIARLFGGRDHTTVIHAVEKVQRLMSERKQIYDQVTDLLQQLKA